MARMKKLLQRGMSISVALLMVLLLWPVIPLQGGQALADEESAHVEEDQSVHLQSDGDGADADGVDVTGSDAPDPDSDTTLEDQKKEDEKVFERIAAVLEDKDYVYLESTELEEDDFLPDSWPELKLANEYTYKVDADDADDGLKTSESIEVKLPSAGKSIFELFITPLDVFSSPELVKIDVFYADEANAAFSIQFNVSAVGKQTITDLVFEKLPFRLTADEQEGNAQGNVEKAIEGKVSSKDLQELADANESVLASFSITSYPTMDELKTGASCQAGIAFALNSKLEGKYQIDPMPTEIGIGSIQETPLPAGFSLTDGASASAWKNSNSMAAVYAGHTLAKSLDDTFANEVELNAAEGSYSGIELYAKDGTGVITKVTNIAYKLDRTAPLLTAFSVDGDHADQGVFRFFNNDAQVTVAVVDPTENAGKPDDSTGYERPFLPAPEISGLVTEGARVEYEDSGQRKIVEGIAITGASHESGTMQFVVDGDQDIEVGSYRAHVRDAAGNQLDSDMSGVKQIPASIMRVVTDSGAPLLSVSYNNNDVRNGGYFNSGRTGTFTITEPNFDYLREYDGDQIVVSITEDGQTHVFRVKDFQPVGADQWQVSYDFFSNAAYTVDARVEDLVGKSSDYYSSSFTVDTSAPSINVTFDNENAATGSYYNAARTATVSITEHNFSSDLVNVALTSNAGNGSNATPASQGGWSNDGDTHTCTVSFAGPGVYSMTISGTDLALNPLAEYTCPEFTVDTEKPQISIQVNGDTDASTRAYRDGCGVSVSIDDTNADPSSTVTITPIGLNGTTNPYVSSPSVSATQITYACADPARNPENDNVYRIEVNAMDMAGNTETKVVDWSVNRFGSTYVLDSDTQDMVNRRYLKTEDTHDVHITEINPSGINEEDVLVSLASGAKNNTLQRDQHYTFQPNTANNWPAYEYVINKDNFASDGTYQVMLHSTDTAGNASMNTMDNKSFDRTSSAEVVFSVDNTAPIVTFNGFNEDSVSANSHEVGFSIEDNTKLDRAVVRINGEKVQTLDSEALSDPSNLRLTLNESGDTQMVTVEAYDMANNMDPQDSPSIFVNSNPLLRWLHNPVLIVGALAVIAAIAAAVIFLLVPFLKHRKGL